jgi:hypothetical protein
VISLPNPKTKMTLSHAQIEDLRQTYAEMVVDGMDMDTLVAFAIDSIVDALPVNEQALIEEIRQFYDDDFVQDLVESVTQDS